MRPNEGWLSFPRRSLACPDRKTEGAKIEISRGRLLHPCTVEAVSSKKDENDGKLSPLPLNNSSKFEFI